MLRCRPSEITLTSADVEETRRHLARRQSTGHAVLPLRLAGPRPMPQIRRGPDHARNDAITRLGAIPVLRPQAVVPYSADESDDDRPPDPNAHFQRPVPSRRFPQETDSVPQRGDDALPEPAPGQASVPWPQSGLPPTGPHALRPTIDRFHVDPSEGQNDGPAESPIPTDGASDAEHASNDAAMGSRTRRVQALLRNNYAPSPLHQTQTVSPPRRPLIGKEWTCPEELICPKRTRTRQEKARLEAPSTCLQGPWMHDEASSSSEVGTAAMIPPSNPLFRQLTSRDFAQTRRRDDCSSSGHTHGAGSSPSELWRAQLDEYAPLTPAAARRCSLPDIRTAAHPRTSHKSTRLITSSDYVGRGQDAANAAQRDLASPLDLLQRRASSHASRMPLSTNPAFSLGAAALSDPPHDASGRPALPGYHAPGYRTASRDRTAVCLGVIGSLTVSAYASSTTRMCFSSQI